MTGTNRIDGFQRAPIDLRRYRQFIHAVKIEWGSVLQFILETRIHWTDTEPKGLPFTCPGDIKILFNDWPYGVDPKIVHLVVWTKFELPEDAATNDLTPQARALIEKYVNKTFADRLGKDNVRPFFLLRLLRLCTKYQEGRMVQKLEKSEECPCHRAFSRHAQQS